METLWFCYVSFMLVMYVLLDGFDLGAGIIHLHVARSDAERRMVINAIGPLWDGNEVWLIAAGGTLYFAFPTVYASAFSGFYLPLIIILWLLMLRGLGIEFRHQFESPLWKSFWDVVFSLGSILLSIFFGAALGNLIRGVPLNREGNFFEPLWTTFTVVPEGGILDWYTLMLAAVSFATLASHGANYIALKTEGPVQERARGAAWTGIKGTLLFSALAIAGTLVVRPEILSNFVSRPWGTIFPLLGLAGLAGMVYFNRTKRELPAFLSSGLFIIGMLAATAFGVFPVLVHASTDPAFSLTAFNAAAGDYSLRIGMIWWTIGIALALSYFVYAFAAFRGKVQALPASEGY